MKIIMMDVSIIIPIYNTNYEWVEECIESCIVNVNNNKNLNIEIIICDNCSTDKSLISLLDNYTNKYEYIKVFHQSKNSSLSNCLNFLIKQSSGKYICYISSDDIMISNRIFHQYNFMEKKQNISLCFCYPINTVTSYYSKQYVYDSFKKLNILSNPKDLYYNVILNSSIFFRKSDIIKNDIKFNNCLCLFYDFYLQILTIGLNISPVRFFGIYYRLYEKPDGIKTAYKIKKEILELRNKYIK